MINKWFSAAIFSVVLGAWPTQGVLAETITDLSFSNPVQAADHSNLGGLGPAYSGTTYDFLNVAAGVDMRVTIAAFGNVSFLGSYPNYSSASGQPSGDLGYRYQANSLGSGGINYTMSFFEGGGTFTTAKILPALSLMIYDVDGEPNQDESVRVFAADGFTTYQLPKAGGMTAQAEGMSSMKFTGPGSNRDEDDPTGAVILNCANTSSLTLQMLSDTTGGSTPNPVFSAIDGDLSLIGGNTGSFSQAASVPEPSSFALVVIGLGGAALMRRRRRAG